MEIVINQDNTKHIIKGVFEVCLSVEDMQTITDRFNEQISMGFTYGWVTIYEKPTVRTTANTPPKNWNE